MYSFCFFRDHKKQTNNKSTWIKRTKIRASPFETGCLNNGLKYSLIYWIIFFKKKNASNGFHLFPPLIFEAIFMPEEHSNSVWHDN